MPELPEVETLVRNLSPHLLGAKISQIKIFRTRSLRNTTPRTFRKRFVGRTIQDIKRRGKFLRFALDDGGTFLIHLGMRGRLVLQKPSESLLARRHLIAMFDLCESLLLFYDPRRFGRIEPGDAVLAKLGPEPFSENFSPHYLAERFSGSTAPIKARLLDQSLVAGIGNIYACETLFSARIDPRTPAGALDLSALRRLHDAVRRTLTRALRFGRRLQIDSSSARSLNDLFYFGIATSVKTPLERLFVYDRAGKPCLRCGWRIERVKIVGRGTFFCPRCQLLKMTANK